MIAPVIRTVRPYACLLAVIVLLVSFTGTTAHARIVYGVLDGGLALAGGPDRFKEQVDNGVTFAGGVALAFEERVHLVVRAEYYRLPTAAGSPIEDREALRVIMLGSMLRYLFFDEDEAWRPFIELGYATADLELTSDGAGDTFTEFDTDDLQGVLQIGGGAEFRASDWLRVIVEARFTNINSPYGGESTTIYPLTIGIRF